MLIKVQIYHLILYLPNILVFYISFMESAILLVCQRDAEQPADHQRDAGDSGGLRFVICTILLSQDKYDTCQKNPATAGK